MRGVPGDEGEINGWVVAEGNGRLRCGAKDEAERSYCERTWMRSCGKTLVRRFSCMDCAVRSVKWVISAEV